MQKNQIIIIIIIVLLCVIVMQKPILPFIAFNNVIYKCTLKIPSLSSSFLHTTRHFKHPGTREE
jgi:hypothetical protein